MNFTARLWADRLVNGIDSHLRARLATEPLATLVEAGYRVEASSGLDQRRGAKGWCDGLSFFENGTILYVHTPYSDRENFTILHEFGHLLIEAEEDEDVLVWAADQPAFVLEQVCDHVAAALLVPSSLVSTVLAGARPTGKAVSGLFQSSSASREVCAIAIARRLGCEGFVMVVREGIVTFASRTGDTRPSPWRGDVVPTSHHLCRVDDGEELASVSSWQSPQGIPRPFYLSAFRDGRWTYAVFTEHDLWGIERLHLPDPTQVNRREITRRKVTCDCGFSGSTVAFPCNTCHQRPCPQCGRCECDRREAREERAACRQCTIVVRAHLLVDGLCDNCR